MTDLIYEWAWWYITQPWVWVVSIASLAFDFAVLCGVFHYVKHIQYNGDDDD